MRTNVVSPTDPLADLVDGRYEDDLVVVERRADRWPADVRTPHFALASYDSRLLVTHDLAGCEVSDDLVGVLDDELFAPGWVRGSDTFERLLTGLVRSSAADGLDAWEAFYRNTLDRFATPAEPPRTIERYARTYRHAVRLTPEGSTLETGCCYGFLSVLLAEHGHDAVASDVAEATVALLSEVLPRIGSPVHALRADAGRLPLPAGSVDTVLAIHLLEALEPDPGQRALREAVRVARRRVVVAVALADEADEAAGELRTVTTGDLRCWGDTTGLPYDVHEHAGDGWLVVDLD